jgi:hypothetical protein
VPPPLFIVPVSDVLEQWAMRKPQSMRALEDLGRVRPSRNSFQRDFLYSEIAGFYGIRNCRAAEMVHVHRQTSRPYVIVSKPR